MEDKADKKNIPLNVRINEKQDAYIREVMKYHNMNRSEAIQHLLLKLQILGVK